MLKKTHFTSEITEKLDGKEVILCGWVHRIRDLGKIKFVVLRDSRGFIQLIARKDSSGDKVFAEVSRLKPEYVIAVRGIVKRSKIAKSGVEVEVKELEVLNESKAPLPLDVTGSVKAELKTRLDNRVLDLRREENQALFRIRDRVVRTIQEFLRAEGFMEVHTPKIIATATEGGAALFRIDYYGRKAFLSQSPQLYKEQLTAAFERVFEIGPAFRAEESHTRRHVSEFISVDIEAAFMDENDVMGVLERMIKRVYEDVNRFCSKELKVLGVQLKTPNTPFKRITYDEALEILKSEGLEVKWGDDLDTPALRKLATHFKDPYFIVDWPTTTKPFYIMPKEENPEICYAFDLMIGHVEIASGGRRIHKEELLIKRLRECGLNPKDFEHHLKFFRYGMPPHAGWAVGLDRLVMVLTGKRNIREVILYPRDIERLTP